MTEKMRTRERSLHDLVRTNIELVAALERATLKDQKKGRVEILADRVARSASHISFVYIHVLFISLWMLLNVHHRSPLWGVDPFPFEFLSLALSVESIVLSTVILMKQTREAMVADRRNHLDLQINLLSEQENSKIIAMLAALIQHHGIDMPLPELKGLEEETNHEELLEEIRVMTERENEH